MAHYDEMNDPMEGAFYSNVTDRRMLEDIIRGKQKKLICCFSTDYRQTLLWSHYADSHQGCCLEVEVTSKLDPYRVNYSPYMPTVYDSNCDSSIERILTHKSDYWKYENEVRFFKNELTANNYKAKPWLSININRVLLGYRMKKEDVTFYEKLIHSVLGSHVEVRQIKKEELDTGLK